MTILEDTKKQVYAPLLLKSISETEFMGIDDLKDKFQCTCKECGVGMLSYKRVPVYLNELVAAGIVEKKELYRRLK